MKTTKDDEDYSKQGILDLLHSNIGSCVGLLNTYKYTDERLYAVHLKLQSLERELDELKTEAKLYHE